MVSEVLTRNCKRCDSQYITTDIRKIFCTKSCAQKYSAMEQHSKRRGKKRHREYRREYRLKANYGITLEEYNQMFEEQNGCCAICETHQSKLKQTLCVDHCHQTKKVRKLLCSNCNRGIGMFQDNAKLLIKAAEYLT